MSGDHSPSKVVNLSELKVACRDCQVQSLCLPLGMEEADLQRLDRIVKRGRPLKRDTAIYHAGDPMKALYIVRSGSVKTFTLGDDGQMQIMAFHLPGEIIGLDALATGVHASSARTLETASICEIPFHLLEDMASEVQSLNRQLLRFMSKELYTDSQLMLLLGKKTAEERLASFLLNLSTRYEERGFSPREFHLPMSRGDIANYLGLAVETVSRVLTRLQTLGILHVRRKLIVIDDLERLRETAGQGDRGHQRQPAAR